MRRYNVNILTTANVHKEKDICKVLDYFRYNTGTTLDATTATRVPRNSVTWYVKDFEESGMVQVVCRKPDRHTKRMAKHYSANPNLWRKPDNVELPLFGGMENGR